MAVATLNRESFRALFDEYYDLICNYLNGQTRDWDLSQEIAQKTFVKLWEKRDSITFTSSSKSYLYQAARHTLIDYYRSTKSATVNAERYSEQQDRELNMEEPSQEGLAVTQQIAWAVEKLKPKTRKIFLLNKQEGLTYEEIATYMDISKRTVEYNMKNALIQLRDLLKGKMN